MRIYNSLFFSFLFFALRQWKEEEKSAHHDKYKNWKYFPHTLPSLPSIRSINVNVYIRLLWYIYYKYAFFFSAHLNCRFAVVGFVVPMLNHQCVCVCPVLLFKHEPKIEEKERQKNMHTAQWNNLNSRHTNEILLMKNSGSYGGRARTVQHQFLKWDR